jgi:hypothetical protein
MLYVMVTQKPQVAASMVSSEPLPKIVFMLHGFIGWVFETSQFFTAVSAVAVRHNFASCVQL